MEANGSGYKPFVMVLCVIQCIRKGIPLSQAGTFFTTMVGACSPSAIFPPKKKTKNLMVNKMFAD